MRFRRDQRGFIFSLDATLAMLVVMIVMAGVARVGGPELTYGQHGYLILTRYAEDALEVMDRVGVLDNVIELIITGNDSQASETARNNLRTILPPEIQFKFVIGEEENPYLDNVYPGTDNQTWESVFGSAAEIAVASRVTAERLTPLKVLVWVDTRLPGNQTQMIIDFVENIRKPSWDVRTTSDEAEFRVYLLTGLMGWSPDAVFIPDSLDLQDATIDALIWNYNINYGGVVGGGGFAPNQDYNFPFFGVWALPPVDSELGHEDMFIVDHTHPITATSPHYVEYAGNNYPVYEYLFLNPITGEKATPLVDNLAYWLGTGGYWWGGTYIDQDWVAMTGRRSGIIIQDVGENRYNRTVLFNAHLAQSAMEGTGTNNWIELAQRAIEWVSNAEFEPIKLFVWRGEEVS